MTQITQSEQGATGRFINMGSPAVLDDLGPKTVIAYCSLAAAPALLGYLFGKQAVTNWDRLLVSTTNKLVFGQDSSGTALNPEVQSADNTVNITGTAQHLQADYDGTLLGSGINVYVDASAALTPTPAATNGTGTLNSDAAGELFLMNRSGLGREFVGKLFYLAMWNRILTAGERTTARANGPLAVPSGLVLCYANGQDYSTFAHPVVARSTFVDGGLPSNVNLGPAAATTLTGPSSGTNGVASTNFTVGADGSITGTVIITPSDAGNGGTFTPTTVSINTATPTGTFTYTPASTGAKTISTTNNGALTNPTSLTYTSNSSAATATTLSGPSSGTVSVASTNFTVGANGTITGTVIITPADAANGGTFTPTTVSINTASPTGTFTYTPASTGVKTISTTNNGALTNPTAISYTSNSAGGSAVGAAALIYQMIGDSNV